MPHSENWERHLPPLRRCRGFGPPIDPKLAEHTVAAPPPPERVPPRTTLRKLAFARRQAMLWAWVDRQMRETLTYNQQWSIRLYDLAGLTYKKAGVKLGLHPSNVLRARNDGIERLRDLASEQNVSWDNPPPSGPNRIRKR